MPLSVLITFKNAYFYHPFFKLRSFMLISLQNAYFSTMLSLNQSFTCPVFGVADYRESTVLIKIERIIERRLVDSIGSGPQQDKGMKIKHETNNYFINIFSDQNVPMREGKPPLIGVIDEGTKSVRFVVRKIQKYLKFCRSYNCCNDWTNVSYYQPGVAGSILFQQSPPSLQKIVFPHIIMAQEEFKLTQEC